MSLYGDLPPPSKEGNAPVKKPTAEDGASAAAKSTLPAGWSSVTRFKPINRKPVPPKQKPTMRGIPAGFVSQSITSSTTTTSTAITESQNGVTTVYSAPPTVISSTITSTAQAPQDKAKTVDENSWLRARTAQVQRQDNDVQGWRQPKRVPVKNQQGSMSLSDEYDIARPNEFEEFKLLFENERRQLEEERRSLGKPGAGPGYPRFSGSRSRSRSSSPYRSRSRGRRSRSRSYSRSPSRTRSRSRSRSPIRRRGSPSKERLLRGRSRSRSRSRSHSRSRSRSPTPPNGGRRLDTVASSSPSHGGSNEFIRTRSVSEFASSAAASEHGQAGQRRSSSTSRSRDRRRSRSRTPPNRRMGRSRSRSRSRSPPYGSRRSPSPLYKRSRQHSPPAQPSAGPYKAFAPPPSQSNVQAPVRPVERECIVAAASSSVPASPVQNKPAFVMNDASGEEAFNRRAMLSQQRSQPASQQQQSPQYQQQRQPPQQQQQQQQRPAFVPAAQASIFKGTPSPVILLTNMVGPGEVDDTLQEETAAECEKFGAVVRCLIFEIQKGKIAPEEAVRIFVKFGSKEAAERALKDLHGRFFGGRQVRGQFYDEARFDALQLAP
ncbi:hypothetical protein BGZ95_002176 [Linnemannia exigua]|uniref:RRM domain-containing protein n=1 Tax=Linnemannia exigua TaxID=604196 RepID=A0AAD4D5U7_9FUNG|nr:hypothetical protein BGZ95_002176 [Linnemannia exigua]